MGIPLAIATLPSTCMVEVKEKRLTHMKSLDVYNYIFYGRFIVVFLNNK